MLASIAALSSIVLKSARDEPGSICINKVVVGFYQATVCIVKRMNQPLAMNSSCAANVARSSFAPRNARKGPRRVTVSTVDGGRNRMVRLVEPLQWLRILSRLAVSRTHPYYKW